MNRSVFSIVAIAALTLSAVSQQARADINTYSFTGTIFYIDDALGYFDGATTSTTISGSFSYGTYAEDYLAVLDLTSFSPGYYLFGTGTVSDYGDAYGPAAADGPVAPVGISVTLGTTNTPSFTTGEGGRADVSYTNSATNDGFGISTSDIVGIDRPQESLSVSFADPTGTFFGASLLPPATIDLASYDPTEVLGGLTIGNMLDSEDPAYLSSHINFRIDSMNLESVVVTPEPTTLAMFGLGSLLLSRRRRD